MKKLSWLLLVLVVTLCSRSTMADSVTIIPTVSQNEDSYTYEYTLANSGTTSFILFELYVLGPVSNLVAPNGWSVNTTVDEQSTAIGWLAFDASPGITPGSSLAGFSFTSMFQPGQRGFTVFDENFTPSVGQTTGPAIDPASSPIPEPTTIALLGVGLAAAGAAIRKRRTH